MKIIIPTNCPICQKQLTVSQMSLATVSCKENDSDPALYHLYIGGYLEDKFTIINGSFLINQIALYINARDYDSTMLIDGSSNIIATIKDCQTLDQLCDEIMFVYESLLFQ